jgi:hypothetical protein
MGARELHELVPLNRATAEQRPTSGSHRMAPDTCGRKSRRSAALARVMSAVLKDYTELFKRFSDNESINKLAVRLDLRRDLRPA